MTIEYSLTRTDVARSYFQALANSPQYLRTILCLAALVGVFQLVVRGFANKALRGSDFVFAFLIFVLTLALLPAILFLRAKTDRRVLTISQEGISTTIGKKSAEIPWKKVKIVKDGGNFILLSSMGGNAFFIPNRAFPDSTDRSQFLNEMSSYRSQAQAAGN